MEKCLLRGPLRLSTPMETHRERQGEGQTERNRERNILVEFDTLGWKNLKT